MKNAVALGTFDGLHKGHLSVLNIPDSYNKIALIFSIPPKCIKKGTTELLLTPEEKQKRLEEMGFKVFSLNFNEVEHLSPKEFLEYIKTEFGPELISCGFNYRFGFKGEGDTLFLESFCRENGIKLNVSEPIRDNGDTISSSLIRHALRDGNILTANRLLGYGFYFESQVIHGDGRGKTLGFPTVNQKYPENLVPLKFGVYKTEVLIDNKKYKGITNIGHRPTFPLDYIISETFIKDFEGDLYGRSFKITFKEFLREEKKFSSAEELKTAVLSDIEKI